MSLKKIVFTFFFLMSAWSVQATHLRSAHIKIEPLCLSTLTYRITVTVYMNTLSQTPFGGFTDFDGHINFGDGILHIIPETQAIARPDLGPNIGVASYSVEHTYASSGFYQVTYFERDRSAGILNIPNSGDVPYVSWTSLLVSPETVCNTLPILTIPPVDRACSFNTFSHTPGAFDVEGDSLSYELGVPFRNADNPVNGYVAPDDSRFYTDYSHGNEDGTGPPSFLINPLTGLITWNAPGMAGEYNIAFRIREWRKDQLNGTYQLLSITTRDMQIVVGVCVNRRPDLIDIPKDTCVVAGGILDFTITGIDPEEREVKIEVFSELVDLPADKLPPTYSPQPAVFRPSDPPAELNFHWTTDCIHPRQQPYQVVFKITDNPPHEAQLTAFKTWNIKVMAPAPVWKNHTLDLVNRHTVLEWEPYTCQNARAIQIWRKVGKYLYAPGKCDAGIPKSLDYDLIGEVDPSEITFTDTNFDRGLSVGAQYCYRLVAAFDANTSSIISPDFCFDPIETDAPVITHVTVENTSSTDGRIRVSWRSPFAINKSQFPEPYEYELHRAFGFADNAEFVKIEERVKDDTTFLDQSLNTKDSVYNYRIVVYSIPLGGDKFTFVDTSAWASSEWLTTIPGLNQIELNWRDSVPWSNVVFDNPWHRIYRGVHGEPQLEMVLLDSVNVGINGYYYRDENLQYNVYYTYRILTRGTYGNPKIKLQENFSQIASQYPESDLLPCSAENSIVLLDCKTFRMTTPCEQDKFSNTIYWSMLPSDTCRMDIDYYKVYTASDSTGQFELLADHVWEPQFADNNLSSFAKCYKVSAVDTRGQEGPLSNAVCNKNCPFFSLPNMFTPNDDGCNDLFSAFYYPSVPGGLCHDPDIFMCPRFVNHVSFRVFNRWGREVYAYSSGENKPITINWDGRDNNGNELENGIYFYRADVKFEVNDPASQKDKIKGWIHLMR